MVIQSVPSPDKDDDSIVRPQAQTEDNSPVWENVLRPKKLTEYIGQQAIKENLKVFVQAAQERQEELDHLLFYGPPGLGKTTLAIILAAEMQAPIRITSGPAIEKPGDLAAILTNLQPGEFLFIDEIHRLRLPVEEVLYSAMEDFAIDLVVGKGPSARTMRLDLPKFTLVGATTQLSRLSSPLRDRFGHQERLRYYENEEIEQILQRSAQILEIKIEKDGASFLAQCCRATPRIANRLLRRLRDFSQIAKEKAISRNTVIGSLKKMSIDELGLDFSDQHYLKTLCEKFGGGPAGLSTLASATGEDSATLEDVVEPFLIQKGFLERTPRGRLATTAAFDHLDISPPLQKSSLFSS